MARTTHRSTTAESPIGASSAMPIGRPSHSRQECRHTYFGMPLAGLGTVPMRLLLRPSPRQTQWMMSSTTSVRRGYHHISSGTHHQRDQRGQPPLESFRSFLRRLPSNPHLLHPQRSRREKTILPNVLDGYHPIFSATHLVHPHNRVVPCGARDCPRICSGIGTTHTQVRVPCWRVDAVVC